MPRRRQDQGISVVLNKRLNLAVALRFEDGAGALQQAPTWPHQRPKGFQELALNGGQLGYIGLAP